MRAFKALTRIVTGPVEFLPGAIVTEADLGDDFDRVLERQQGILLDQNPTPLPSEVNITKSDVLVEDPAEKAKAAALAGVDLTKVPEGKPPVVPVLEVSNPAEDFSSEPGTAPHTTHQEPAPVVAAPTQPVVVAPTEPIPAPKLAVQKTSEAAAAEAPRDQPPENPRAFQTSELEGMDLEQLNLLVVADGVTPPFATRDEAVAFLTSGK